MTLAQLGGYAALRLPPPAPTARVPGPIPTSARAAQAQQESQEREPVPLDLPRVAGSPQPLAKSPRQNYYAPDVADEPEAAQGDRGAAVPVAPRLQRVGLPRRAAGKVERHLVGHSA